MSRRKGDAVNQPSHYTMGGVEVIDAIEAWQLGFKLGNTVKYIARAGRKDPRKALEDLKKARWYLEREIREREKPKGKTRSKASASTRRRQSSRSSKARSLRRW